MAAPTIFYDGTTQHMVFELTKASPAEDPVFSGTTDGEALTNCQIKFKLLGGAWSTVTNPTITWDATGQYWEGEVPAGVVSGCGQAVVIVVSTASAFATLKILVNVVLPASTFTAIKNITDLLTLANIKTQASSAITDASLATSAALTTVEGKINALDLVADGIVTTLSTPANFMADVSGLATSAEITAIKGTGWTTESLKAIKDAVALTATATALTTAQGGITAIQAATDTIAAEFDATNGLIGAITVGQSVGAEKVIHPDYYELDAENKRIKLLSPYNALTPEQVKFIKDLDENYIIYNDRETSYETLPITITTEGENTYLNYTTPAQNTVAGNTIQISINM